MLWTKIYYNSLLCPLRLRYTRSRSFLFLRLYWSKQRHHWSECRKNDYKEKKYLFNISEKHKQKSYKKTGTELAAKPTDEPRQHNRFHKKITYMYELKANCQASQWWQLTWQLTWLKNFQGCVTKMSVQARALPYKALLGHYYVMNVSFRIRIRLTGLQRVGCVEIWNADLRQTKI